MKSKQLPFILFMACAMLTFSVASAKELKIGVVDFKKCVENSRQGKDELENFETMKKQMEEVLSAKEKELKEIAAKLGDPDYLDSLSQTAEAELKHKGRALSQEMSRAQNEYYQMMQQANMKVMQMIQEHVAKASEKVAETKNYDFILRDAAIFYANQAHDVTNAVVEQMDKDYKK